MNTLNLIYFDLQNYQHPCMSGHHLSIHLNQARCWITYMIPVNPQMCLAVILSVAPEVCPYATCMTHLPVGPIVIPPGSVSICQYICHPFCLSNHQLNSQCKYPEDCWIKFPKSPNPSKIPFHLYIIRYVC